MMKNVLVFVCVAVLSMSSCIRKQVVLETEHQRDSLATVVDAKDSLLNAVFEDINSISENLALIRSRENLIAVETPDEGGRRPVEEINRDIAAIDRLLQENRSKIASLQGTAARLRKADVKIEALGKTIADLNERVTAKSAEIERLRGEMERMDGEVRILTEQVAERDAAVDSLNSVQVELENRMNEVYYIVGNERELRDAQIIDKQGFIGRTLTVGKSGCLDSFTCGDSRLIEEIPVGHKRVTVVTSHPADSYELTEGEDKTVEKLFIVDQVRFWSASKILIVSYK